MTMTDDRRLLGVAPEADADEVQRAFRRFARTHHPDRGGDVDTFRAGLDAYERLRALPQGSGATVVLYRRPRGWRVPVAWAKQRLDDRHRPPRVH